MSLTERHLATNKPSLCSIRSPVTAPPLLSERRRQTLGEVRPVCGTVKVTKFVLQYATLTVVCVPPLFVPGLLTEVEESTPPLTSKQLHPLHLFLQCSQLLLCTHPHYSTPHTRLALVLSHLLPSVTSPSLFMPLDHQCSTLPGLPLVHSPLFSLFHPRSLSPPSLKKISTDSGTTDRTSELFLFQPHRLMWNLHVKCVTWDYEVSH